MKPPFIYTAQSSASRTTRNGHEHRLFHQSHQTLLRLTTETELNPRLGNRFVLSRMHHAPHLPFSYTQTGSNFLPTGVKGQDTGLVARVTHRERSAPRSAKFNRLVAKIKKKRHTPLDKDALLVRSKAMLRPTQGIHRSAQSRSVVQDD